MINKKKFRLLPGGAEVRTGLARLPGVRVAGASRQLNDEVWNSV
jgi:hypothetical protein